MHLFTIEDYGSTVRHVPLSKDASPRVAGRFRELVANYWSARPRIRAYQPAYTPDSDEVLELATPLPPSLAPLVDRVPAGVPALEANDIENGRPQALVAALPGNAKTWAFQWIGGKSFISQRFALFVGKGTYHLPDGPGLAIGDRIDAIYEGKNLYFHSEIFVRRFLDVDTPFQEATDQRIDDFLGRSEFEPADLDAVKEIAGTLLRRKLSVVMHHIGKGKLDVPALKRAASKLSSRVDALSLKLNAKGKIVVPTDKPGLTALVNLLHDDYVESVVDQTPYYSNSKRRL